MFLRKGGNLNDDTTLFCLVKACGGILKDWGGIFSIKWAMTSMAG